MIEIKRINVNEYSDQLIELSKVWCEEDITNGLVPNELSDLKEPCYAAFDGDKIVGYTFGHFYNADKKINTIKEGDKCFEIDEIYVLKEYRSQGIGRKLFQAIEEEVHKEVEFITLPTSTKDYKKILNFYVEMMDMTFHSAFLYKKTK